MTIKNGDMPANPTNLDISEYEGTINCPYNKPLTGLTKRETFAIAAMQGMSSHPDFYGNSKDYADVISKSCVLLADAMLKALED